MINISLFTRNCGNNIPSHDELFILEEHLLPKNEYRSWPDIIVLGLQEAKREGSILGTFGGKSVTRLLSNNLKNNYKILKILYDGSYQRHRQLSETWHSMQRKWGADVIKEYKANLEGKGGIFSRIFYKKYNLCFITSHLDSHNNNQKTKQIDSIINKLSNIFGNNQNCTFFMGDLNYWLSSKNLSNDPYLLAKDILNPKIREELWKADTLNSSILISKHRFNFPKPQPALFYPSYKRSEKHKNDCKIIGTLDVTKDNTGKIKNAFNCFFAVTLTWKILFNKIFEIIIYKFFKKLNTKLPIYSEYGILEPYSQDFVYHSKKKAQLKMKNLRQQHCSFE